MVRKSKVPSTHDSLNSAGAGDAGLTRNASPDEPLPSQSMKGFGLFTLTMLVVANMIGVGVYTSSGFALDSLGNPTRVLFGWILAGCWAIAGAIAYGSLASRVPLSGGEYLYLSRLMHPSVGFLAGWISLIAGFTAPIAASAKLVIVHGFPQLSEPTSQAIAASLVVVVVLGFHVANLGLGVIAQNLVVVTKLILFLAVFIWAMTSPSESWHGGVLPGRAASWLPSGFSEWHVMFGSLLWLGFSYTGFNAAVYVAGQSTDAQRNVPRSMLLATIIVMVIYVGINAIFVFAPESSEVVATPASKASIAAIASRALGGATFENLVRLLIALSVLSSVFSMLMAGPRVYWQMARDGVMPRWFDTSGEIPRLALLFQATLSILVIWISSLEQLIGYLGLTLSMCSSLTIASLWWLPRLPAAGQSSPPRPLAWWEHAAAATYITGTLLMVAASVNFLTSQLIAAAITFCLGIAIYAIWQVRSRAPR